MRIKIVPSKKSNRGFTVVELLVSMTIFLAVMVLGFNFFLRSQRLTQLAESEAKMQMYARQAMTVITKELRQTSAYKEYLDPNEPTRKPKDIRFVRPKQGAIGQYILVRYWYEENSQGVYSLYRAERDNGTSPQTPADTDTFKPSVNSASDRVTYKISPLIKEATVIDPGEQSFFEQNTAAGHRRELFIRLVTATYGIKSGTLTNEYEVKRRFNLDSAVYARNLNE